MYGRNNINGSITLGYRITTLYMLQVDLRVPRRSDGNKGNDPLPV